MVSRRAPPVRRARGAPRRGPAGAPGALPRPGRRAGDHGLQGEAQGVAREPAREVVALLVSAPPAAVVLLDDVNHVAHLQVELVCLVGLVLYNRDGLTEVGPFIEKLGGVLSGFHSALMEQPPATGPGRVDA